MNIEIEQINQRDSNGLRQGLCRYWYDKGQLMHEMYYVDDILHGLRKSWYKDGDLIWEGYYVNGTQEGEQIRYDI